MAQKATIFKAELAIADMDRGHFATHALTLARHPSETDERMMVRLLAYALNADDALEFLPGSNEVEIRCEGGRARGSPAQAERE